MSGYESRVEVQMVNFYRSLSEMDRRRYAAVEAGKLGHGGVAYVGRLFGCLVVIRIRFDAVLPMLSSYPKIVPRVASEKQGGRKKASLAEPELVSHLRELVEHHTAGSAVEPDRVWTSRSPLCQDS